MFIPILIRVSLGTLLAAFGYLLSDNLLKDEVSLFGVPYLAQTLAAFSLGVFGVFLLPILATLIKTWFNQFITTVIKESVRDSIGQFLSQRKPSLRLKTSLDHGEKSDTLDELSNFSEKNPAILDTSAIIDGRIGQVIKMGFLSGPILVPRFVLEELKHIADSGDEIRRNRGRKGLELLDELKKSKEINFNIFEQDFSKIKGVDAKIVKLANSLKGRLVTTDYNLNKVAQLTETKILNINELANALKTVVLPGEELKVKIIQEGKEPNQGVGYLSDGTMIVVENGKNHVGKEINVEVNRIFQTAAGKMVFVKIKNEAPRT